MNLLNVILLTVGNELLIIKLGTMISDESMWQTIPVNNILPDKLVNPFVQHVNERFRLNPLGEIIDSDYQIFESSFGG